MLAIDPISKTEQQLIAALQGFFPGVPVQGMPALDTEDVLALFASTAPAIYVSIAPMTLAQGRTGLAWEVILTSPTGAGQDTARYGGAGLLGLNAMAWHLAVASANGIATDLVNLYQDGFGWLDGAPGKRAAELGVVVGAAILAGVCSTPSATDLDALPDFKVVHASIDLPPHASQADRQALANEIPVPGLPDAEEVVQL
jgi:hypothetical protein